MSYGVHKVAPIHGTMNKLNTTSGAGYMEVKVKTN